MRGFNWRSYARQCLTSRSVCPQHINKLSAKKPYSSDGPSTKTTTHIDFEPIEASPVENASSNVHNIMDGHSSCCFVCPSEAKSFSLFLPLISGSAVKLAQSRAKIHFVDLYYTSLKSEPKYA